jgi:hypothetical protein
VDRVEDVLADEARRSLDVPGIAQVPVPSVAMAPGFVDAGIGFTITFHVVSFAEQGSVQHTIRKRVAMRLKKEGIALGTVSAAVLRRE